MTDMHYIVQDTQTGEKFVWDLCRVLSEINRDRSADWKNYDETDWTEGWSEWVDGYKIVGLHRNKR